MTDNNFTEGRILSKLFKFMIPILGALVLQAMYGAVDILIVGQFGTTAGISAVSTGSNIVNLVIFTVTGLAMGITVVIGMYLGQKKRTEDRKTDRRCDLFLYCCFCCTFRVHADFCTTAGHADAGSRGGT